MDRILVTGGAGFIGSGIVQRLLSEGFNVDVLDNLSSGKIENVDQFKKFPNFKFLKIDLLNSRDLNGLKKYKIVYHAAADPEVRTSVTNPKTHLEQNIIATFNLLETLKNGNLENFVFLSTSTVYGEVKTIPTPEDYSPLEPISPYGATKLACEALISSFAHSFGFKGTIFRFANIVGESSNHGVTFDFVNKLKKNPSSLEILGDGSQDKSYLYISDCIDAIQFGLKHTSNPIEIFNVGSEDRVDVSTIAKSIINEMSLSNVELTYTGGVDGGRGWKGDIKNMHLDISKLKSKGWKPKYNSLEAVKMTARKIISNSN